MKRISKLEKLLNRTKTAVAGSLEIRAELFPTTVPSQVTLADIMAFSMIDDKLPGILDIKDGEFDLKEHYLLKAFVERFKAQEKIADWIKRRPQTAY
ncbi:hypothetical protein HOLleu_11560 [Holothuria leucospilota]|uniref:GST C-terminal domain-containing protein n=1 Tax=Holothuria leucospilota TaxID=206669 RepID=A0A9Q1HFN6_HOLLE|nr:hypothetical protein HOLleu_11560 [Holothuria leucospilota]